ncbi:MAG: bifunctional folylpolyglutamate synthase/dihydrofolate synthase, partial [Clostridia bacterium]|nr:bifunctional folylpolyglutamate synthase/dihydrofolate synthase [Clostridia bacterium]
MNYPQALQFIHSLDRFGIRPGLQRIQALCRALGDPQERLSFVHVGGTNGKGSVSTMLSEMLRAEGKRVGLFTSPYVVHFLERIQVGGKPVEEAAFAETVTRLEPIVHHLAEQGMQPTEFEVITAVAFDLFAAASCDVVVLEVGLGGRLDSTNIIDTPLVSVITSISLDHMAILGDTVEQIAAEKAGIIKPNGRTVCYPDQPGGVMDVIRAACIDKQNSFTVPELAAVKTVKNDLFGTRFFYEGTEYETAMGGAHQIKNAVTAIEAARLLGLSLSSIQSGLKRAKLAARQEVICRKPLVLLDGGHNEDGGRVL